MAVVEVVNSGAHPRNQSGIYLKSNLRDNSKPRKGENVGRGVAQKKANGSKSEHIQSVL